METVDRRCSAAHREPVPGKAEPVRPATLRQDDAGHPALRGTLQHTVARLLQTSLFPATLVGRGDLQWSPTRQQDPHAGTGDPGVWDDEAPLPPRGSDWASIGHDPRYRHIERLSAQDERRFVMLARAGDRYASQKLIVHHLPLLRSLARRYANCGMSSGELVNEGSIGLLRAIERFDLARGLRFGTYARWWIRDAIEQALQKQARLIRLPQHVLRSLRRQAQGAGPSGPASEVGEPAPAVAQVLEYGDADDEVDRIEQVPDASTPETVLFAKQVHERLLDALASLNDRERHVLQARFGLDDTPPMTLEALATELKLSHERVRQIQMAALRKMRAALGEGVGHA